MSPRTENWIRKAPGTAQRIEACLNGRAFAPHRHDTYAIGITLAGVQSFDYRGAARHSLPGQIVVLHPDELHDGRAGTDEAFRYRTLYLDPAFMQEILNGKPLPFIKGGISSDIRLARPVRRLLSDYDCALEPLKYEDGLYDLVMALRAISEGSKAIPPHNYQAARKARDYILESLDEKITLEALEAVTGRDRWALSRDFRAVYGTSPYRYLVQRRLEQAKAMIQDGNAIADAAFACWFADQSHFNRHFKKAFGMTPDAWRTIVLSDQ